MVIRSEHRNSFDGFMDALSQTNDVLRDQIITELHVVSAKELIHDMARTTFSPLPERTSGDEHDERDSDETFVKRVVCDDNERSVQMRRRQWSCSRQEAAAQENDDRDTYVKTILDDDNCEVSVEMRGCKRPHRRQNAFNRQEAFEYVSRQRESRGEIPLKDLPQSEYPDAIRLEMTIAVKRRRSSAATLQGDLAQRTLQNLNETLELLDLSDPDDISDTDRDSRASSHA